MSKPIVIPAAILMAATLVSGCRSYEAMQGFPQQMYHVKTQIRNLSKLVESEGANLAAIDNDKNTNARNKYIYDCVALANLQYDMFLKKVSGIKNAVDAGKDIAVGAMGAVGAIVGGGAAQALSAGVAATTAGGVAIDKTFFYNSTMPTMITAMNAERTAVYTDIAIGLNKEYKEYPISTAVSDLERYYFAGTLAGAQSSIQKNSGNKATKEAANTANASDIAKGQTDPNASSEQKEKLMLFKNSRQ